MKKSKKLTFLEYKICNISKSINLQNTYTFSVESVFTRNKMHWLIPQTHLLQSNLNICFIWNMYTLYENSEYIFTQRLRDLNILFDYNYAIICQILYSIRLFNILCISWIYYNLTLIARYPFRIFVWRCFTTSGRVHFPAKENHMYLNHGAAE
jgi:hypothetical protein